jgi:hypothetical protein
MLRGKLFPLDPYYSSIHAVFSLGLARRLEPHGLLLTVRDISRALGWDRYVYGVRTMPQGSHHAEIGHDLMPQGRFPDGRYD